MARTAARSSIAAKEIVRLTKTTGCGGGLFFIVKGANRTWAVRFISPITKKTREAGLGAYPTVALAQARDRADEIRQAVRVGRDPLAERAGVVAETAKMTSFSMAMEQHIDDIKSGWATPIEGKVAVSEAQWRSSLRVHVIPALGSRPAREITSADVQAVLQPLWHSRPTTANRVRQRIERILSSASVREEWVGWTNPAMWRGRLDHMMPRRRIEKGHFKAMAFPEVPAFMQRLRGETNVAARALEMLILTSARPGMVRHARWEEIDTAARVWRVPPAHMKDRRAFDVPLSDAALKVLDAVRPLSRRPSSPIFPGNRKDMGISENAMRGLLIRMDVVHEATAHGFRSAMRDWGGELTSHPSDVLEMVLDHELPGGAVRGAYQRGNLLDKRRVVMDEWAAYLT